MVKAYLRIITFHKEVEYSPLIIGCWKFSPGDNFANNLHPGHLVIIIGNQVKTEAIYNEPDCIQQHKSKKEEAELEECPAYEQAKKDLDLEECPTYEQAKKELELRECPPYVEKRKDDIN